MSIIPSDNSGSNLASNAATRTWFITGINSGFGRQLTEQLLARGHRVAGTVRKAGSVDDLIRQYGDRLWVGLLDVTDTAQVRQVVDEAVAALGRVDVVVNNAGFGLFGAAEEVTDQQIADIINTNLIGSIQVVRAALPHLRAQGGGRIIQMSTYGGQAVNPGASLYHASKWGIEGFMESTALDVAPFNIGITIVEPGGARTEFRFDSLKLAEPLTDYDATPAAWFAAPRTAAALRSATRRRWRRRSSPPPRPSPRRCVWCSAATHTASSQPRSTSASLTWRHRPTRRLRPTGPMAERRSDRLASPRS